MPKLKISDIIQPAVWLPYVQERTTALSLLIKSGVVVVDPVLQSKLGLGGAPFLNVPNYSPLSGSSQVLSDSGDLDVNGLTTARQIAYVLARGDARSVNDLAKWRSGDDPAKAIANGWAEWWAGDEQVILLAILTGIFADNTANDSADMIHDISIEDGDNATAANKISGNAVLDAAQKLGDAKSKLAVMFVHSQVGTNLGKLDGCETVRDSEGNLLFRSYKGLTFFEDDTCTTETGATSGTKYTSFLCAKGAVGRADIFDPATGFESDRDILAGDTVMTMRKQLILHPYGYQGAYAAGDLVGDTAANTELDDADA